MRLPVLLALAFAPSAVLAHTSERGFVMLLPTGLYIAGGALAVALSFAVMAAVPSGFFRRVVPDRERLPPEELPPLWPGAISLALLSLLLYTGLTGTRDPLANPLPPVVWSLWWVGFTFLVAILGDLWRVLSPWRALHRLVWRGGPLRAYPAWLGAWPAVALYFAFAWFELIHPAPFDPEILAWAIIGYAVLTLGGMIVFGADAWLGNAEAFSLFFRMVGWLSPFRLRLLRVGALPLSHAAFVVLALGSVTFDGLSRTFWWLDLIGENPLEHPGRTDVMGRNTLGLVATWLALLGASMLAAGGRQGFCRYVVSIVPIAFGYHFAHYLTSFMVDAQHALRATVLPDWYVTASFLADHDSVHMIWNVQVAAIVLAHVAAVAAAHAIALRQHGTPRAALASQLLMTVLMVGYTVLGLWLLSTPVAG